MGLKKLYRQARQQDALAQACWRASNWRSFDVCIAHRNALIEAIVEHPKNNHTRMAVNCRVIAGLSGRENETFERADA